MIPIVPARACLEGADECDHQFLLAVFHDSVRLSNLQDQQDPYAACCGGGRYVVSD